MKLAFPLLLMLVALSLFAAAAWELGACVVRAVCRIAGGVR